MKLQDRLNIIRRVCYENKGLLATISFQPEDMVNELWLRYEGLRAEDKEKLLYRKVRFRLIDVIRLIGGRKVNKIVEVFEHQSGHTLNEMGYCARDTITDSENKDSCEFYIEKLPNDRIKTIVRLYYYDGYTMQEIADRIERSKFRVCQLLKAAIPQMRAKTYSAGDYNAN